MMEKPQGPHCLVNACYCQISEANWPEPEWETMRVNQEANAKCRKECSSKIHDPYPLINDVNVMNRQAFPCFTFNLGLSSLQQAQS